MLGRYLKPDLTTFFRMMPAIGLWIQNDYDKADTYEDLIELVYKWLDESEQSTNTVREYWYMTSAYYLYSSLTGRSYDTKKFQSF